jgi:hypothetical protein
MARDVSRNGTLLPTQPGSRAAYLIEAARALWERGDVYQTLPYPRSAWLHDLEAVLRSEFPSASSADLRLTARHASSEPFPIFPLRDGPNVP